MNIRIKTTFAAAAAAYSLAATASVPEITYKHMSQEQTTRLVTIDYTLDGAPAVVTLDVQTNCVVGTVTNWASIGGHALWNASGDVWKRVETGPHTITWQPVDTWPGHSIPDGGARAVITAWATNNTPDYMVVDLTDVPDADRFRYYPGADFLPKANFAQTGAPATGNPLYKTSKLLMRKIMARGVEWTMGAESDEWGYGTNELTHYASLTNNYYIGVFEITQRQWELVATNSDVVAQFLTDGAMRPMTGVCYNEIRNTANSKTADAAYNWPSNPAPSSFLGLLRTKTGLDFDLPTEAQWEFAARAGNGSGYWNDGSPIVAVPTWLSEQEALSKLGRYRLNGGYLDGTTTPDESCGPTNGTAIVGSYAPNSWGLYDMLGNATELCLDFYEADIATARDAADGKLYAGRLNINPADPSQTLGGTSSNTRVARGGSYLDEPKKCRPAYRSGLYPQNRYLYAGLRVVCTSGLE